MNFITEEVSTVGIMKKKKKCNKAFKAEVITYSKFDGSPKITDVIMACTLKMNHEGDHIATTHCGKPFEFSDRD